MGNKLTDKNRLSITHPELCKEWDYEKNYPLRPENVCYGSGKKVWWKCKKNHDWEASLDHRSNGENCPYCASKKVSDLNRLTLINPKMAKLWNYKKNYPLRPEEVSYASNKKVWWICDKGHEWKTMINHINDKNRTCPYCCGQKINKENCLETTNPRLAREWNYKRNIGVTPKDITDGSNKKVWWICKKGHEWQTTISNRKKGNDCPYCCSRKVCIDNCLAILNPKLASEWHPTKNGKLTPRDIILKSPKKAWWICNNGHEWQTTIHNRHYGTGCPFCTKISLKDGKFFDSLPEAYYYLINLKSKYKTIKINKRYGMGKYRYDFYIPQINTYIEVTGYNVGSIGIWDKYLKIIKKKKRYVKNVLKAKFKFIQMNLNSKQINYVRQNSM